MHLKKDTQKINSVSKHMAWKERQKKNLLFGSEKTSLPTTVTMNQPMNHFKGHKNPDVEIPVSVNYP
jgi:hypothetical protein